MKNKKNTFNKLSLTLSAAALLFTLLSSSGCSVVNLVKIEGPPSNAEIISGYYDITLKVSSATDSLDEILLPEYRAAQPDKACHRSLRTKKRRVQILAKSRRLR